MTAYFKTIKVPAQDDPCTVDQIRLLTENNRVIERTHRNTIFAAAWDASNTTGNVLGDGASLPSVTYHKDTKRILSGFCLNNKSTSYTGTFTFYYLSDGGNAIEYTEDVTVPNGISWVYFNASMALYTARFSTNQKSGLAFDATGTNVNTTYILHVGFWSIIEDVTTIYEVVDPVLYEVANNLHLRAPASVLNSLNTVPQFLGGWLTTGNGDQITRDAAAGTPESFRLYHLLDYADDQISEDKAYSMEVSKYGSTSTPANDFTAKLYHYESADGNSVDSQVYDYDLIRFGVEGVEGESWSTSANESVIMGDVYTDGAAADNTYLRGVAFSANDTVPYSTNRSQGANRTACDSSYFGAVQDETIDYETINGLGRAQFNSYYRRAGQCQAILFREGKDFGLTTTLVDFWNFHHFIGSAQPWWVNRLTKGTIRGHMCIAASVSSGTSDVEIEITSDATGDSDTLGFNLATGMNYLEDTFELDVEEVVGGSFLDRITTEIRDKTSATTVKIYGVWIGIEDITQTY